jgi:hypothetical protein
MAKEDSTLTICLPGEESWELWKQSAGGASLLQTAAEEGGGTPASFKEANVLAYPVLASFVLPTLAQTADAEMVDAVVSMNLEKNNLRVDDGPGTLTKTRVVERGENHSLAVTSLLQEKVTPQIPAARPTHYELSPFFYYLPDDSLVIWKELGKLVVCVTKADNPVYFQALTSAELDEGAIGEIENLMMPLMFQGIAGDVKQAVLWTEATPEARQALANSLHLPLRVEKRPAPSYTAGESTYEPTAVALAKIREARFRKIRNIVLAVAGVYLALLGVFLFFYFMQLEKNKQLQAQANNLNRVTGHVQPTLESWNLTAPVRNKDGFAAETMRRCLEAVSSRSFPVRITGVRITNEKPTATTETATTLDQQPPTKRIEIKGEAKNPNHATGLKNYLASAADTKIYEWGQVQMGGKAGDFERFTITGSTKKEE